MGLSTPERRILSQIEHELTRDDPRLARRLALLGPATERPRTGWRRPAPTSMRLKRALVAAVAALTVLTLLLMGRLSSPVMDEPRRDVRPPAASCQGPKRQDPAVKCVGEPAGDRPDQIHPYGFGGPRPGPAGYAP